MNLRLISSLVVGLLIAVGSAAASTPPDPAALAQSTADARLAAGLDLHHAAQDFAAERQARQALADVAQEYPEFFLGHFWTAYLDTQVARLVRRGMGEGDAAALLDSAQQHLDRAAGLVAARSDRDRSSVAALQSLVYLFRAGGSSDDRADQWRALEVEALDQAIRLDPDNPVVWVMVGIEVSGKARRDSDLRGLLAGRALLAQADAAFGSESPTHRSQTTGFNSEWLPMWLPRLDDAVKSTGRDAAAESE